MTAITTYLCAVLFGDVCTLERLRPKCDQRLVHTFETKCRQQHNNCAHRSGMYRIQGMCLQFLCVRYI